MEKENTVGSLQWWLLPGPRVPRLPGCQQSAFLRRPFGAVLPWDLLQLANIWHLSSLRGAEFLEFKWLKISILGACSRKREKHPTTPTVATLFIVSPHEKEGEKWADVREGECSWRFAFKTIKPCLRHKTKKRYFVCLHKVQTNHLNKAIFLH